MGCTKYTVVNSSLKDNLDGKAMGTAGQQQYYAEKYIAKIIQ